jgi:hypothetical protein
MKNYVLKILGRYNKKWIAADFILISDLLANSVLGSEYYVIFESLGFSAHAINAVVSFFQMIRMIALLRINHMKE